MGYRSAMGLNTDPTFVQSVLNDPTAASSADLFGVPLSASEVQAVTSRQNTQNAVGLIDDYGAQHQDSYAGVYLDQTQGGLVEVGFTSNPQQHLSELQAIFPYPAQLRVFTASATLAQLHATHDQIFTDWQAGKLGAVQINAVGINEQANKVIVTTPTPSLAGQTTLSTLYGASVTEEEGTATPSATNDNASNEEIPRTKAGLAIGPAGGDNCTSGFVTTEREERAY